jgi:atypical dual specificity phosphatase
MVLLNFSWLEDDSIAGCAYPNDDAALADLAALGISLVINLAERAHDPVALDRHGLVELHLPVPDFTPPTPEQLESGVAAIERTHAAGRRVAVHCAAGLGRTGTLLAAYLVRGGMAPAEAIAQVRARRPGSIETPDQRAAVEAYARRRAPRKEA